MHVHALRRSLAAASANASASLASARGGLSSTPSGPGTTTTTTAAPASLPPLHPHRPVDIGREALDALGRSLEHDRRLAEAMARCRWPALEQLLDAGAPAVLLEVVSEAPPERWFHESAQASLEALRLLTLAPLARRAVMAAVVTVGGGGGLGGAAGGMGPGRAAALGGAAGLAGGRGGAAGAGGAAQQRSGAAVLLTAATLSTSAFFASDPEVVSEALSVITNCVTAPPSLAALLPSAAAGTGGGTRAPASAPHGLFAQGGGTPMRRPDRHPGAGAGAGAGVDPLGGLQQGGVPAKAVADSAPDAATPAAATSAQVRMLSSALRPMAALQDWPTPLCLLALCLLALDFAIRRVPRTDRERCVPENESTTLCVTLKPNARPDPRVHRGPSFHYPSHVFTKPLPLPHPLLPPTPSLPSSQTAPQQPPPLPSPPTTAASLPPWTWAPPRLPWARRWRRGTCLRGRRCVRPTASAASCSCCTRGTDRARRRWRRRRWIASAPWPAARWWAWRQTPPYGTSSHDCRWGDVG